MYVENGYYHIYNRGVEKRSIFQDDQDYYVFLDYLKYSLSDPPKPGDLQGSPLKKVYRLQKNFKNKIELIAFCLMPNHFHLLLKQLDDCSLRYFMLSLITRYSMYFNKKYDRVGSLFQGIYKAVLVNNEEYLLHLSRYIHLNPSEFTPNLTDAFSSYGDYLGLRKTSWLKPDAILDQFNNKVGVEFKKINNYRDFVEKYKQDDKLILGNFALD